MAMPQVSLELFCVCQKPSYGWMIACDGCDEWFHGGCIGLSEENAPEKYFCPKCKSPSNRPTQIKLSFRKNNNVWTFRSIASSSTSQSSYNSHNNGTSLKQESIVTSNSSKNVKSNKRKSSFSPSSAPPQKKPNISQPQSVAAKEPFPTQYTYQPIVDSPEQDSITSSSSSSSSEDSMDDEIPNSNQSIANPLKPTSMEPVKTQSNSNSQNPQPPVVSKTNSITSLNNSSLPIEASKDVSSTKVRQTSSPSKTAAQVSSPSSSSSVQQQGTNVPTETPKEVPKESPKETPKEIPKETPKEIPKETPKEIPKETPKESPNPVSDPSVSSTPSNLRNSAQRQKKPRKKRDPNKPKRATPAYIYFSNEHRAKTQAENPQLTFSEVSKKLGEMWSNLSKEDKKKYTLMSAKDATRFKEEMKHYVPPPQEGEEQEEEEEIDIEEEGKVEKIVNKRYSNNNTLEYLVRWEGFSDICDTWEPSTRLTVKYMPLINEFEQQHAKNTLQPSVSNPETQQSQINSSLLAFLANEFNSETSK